MRAGLAALWMVGAGFIMIGCAAGAAAQIPAPMRITSLTIGEDGTGQARWTLEAAVPRWIPVGGSAPVRLAIRPHASESFDAGVIVASLAAPTAAVTPSGDQVGPGGDRLTFKWSIVPGVPGPFTATPSVAFRPVSGTERLLWAAPIGIRAWTAFGLDASGLTSAAIACGALGVGVILVWVWERRKWNQRRTD